MDSWYRGRMRLVWSWFEFAVLNSYEADLIR